MKRFSTRLFLTSLGGFWLAGFICAAVFNFAAAAFAGDWASWRGPYQDGVSLETGLTSSAKDILWRIPYGGHSTPVIFQGRLYAVNLAGKGINEQDEVYCVDAATGKDLWHYKFNCFHTDVPDSRVGWASPTVDPETGNVYVNGVEGLVMCLDRDGKLVWSKSTTELYGRVTGYGGRTYTPLIDEDRVIVAFNNSSYGAHAIGSHRFVALNKRTGDIVWWSTPGGRPEDPTYSSPVVAVIGGQRLIIAGNADGNLYAIKSRTGEKVWSFAISQRGLNASPVVDGNRVYISHSEENFDTSSMGRVVCIDGTGHGDITKTHELWRADGVDDGYATPLLHNGRLYTMDNSGVLHCFDAVSGRKFWEFVAGREGKGSPVWADGKIYVTLANGQFKILEDKGDVCTMIDSHNFNSGKEKGIEIFSSPAISDGRIAFCTTTEMVCFGKADARPQPVAPEILPDEAPVEKVPAVLLVEPAEVLLKPGESVQFSVQAFDRHGRQIMGTVDAACKFPLNLGAVGPDGRFTAGKRGGIGEVRAELGTLVGTARVRVVPDLPISEDFESFKDGDVIPWWIGVSKAKYAIETLNGNKVLKKLRTEKGPVFDRSLAYITSPIPAGYTVEGDGMAPKAGAIGFRGDFGLVNSRYVLELYGNGKKARVVSWVPGPRFEKKIDFDWQAGAWYRMKFKVEIVDDQAKVLAKVWPRQDAEPKEWTIEATDPQPNYEGSAGTYCNSTRGVVYLDNIKVYR